MVATPFDALALPVPLTVPAPDACANATTVELSEVTVLPAASSTVAVRRRVVPEARFAVEPVSAIWVATPGTTVNAPRVPVARPVAVASIVTVPVRAPVIVLVAMPPEAVALPVPLTVPAPDACAKVITVELSEVTVLPAASSTVAVRTRVVPEVRFAVEPVSAIWVATPGTTLKAPSVPVVSPEAVASIATEPAKAPVIVLVATPLAAVAVPVPLTVPVPEACAKAITVVLSEVTVLPAASSIVAVSIRVAPEARSAVEPVRMMSAAAPCTTSNAPSVPVERPAAVASIVTGPARTPVIVFVATPLEAVALPLPLMVPIPDCLAKAITVVLSEVTMLPAASRIVAVSSRVAPEVRSTVEPLSAIWAGAPATTSNAPSVPVASPPAVASIVTAPTTCPVNVFVATPPEAVALPVPLTRAGAALLRKCDDGRVVGGDGVAGGVLDRRGQDTRGARGEVGSRARQSDLGRGAVDDRERAECPRRQPGCGCLHRDGACELSGDRLGGDTVRNGRVAGAGHRAHAQLLRERDRRRAVREDCVPGGIAERRGQQPRRPGGQVGGRPGDGDLSRRTVDLHDGADAGRVADRVGSGQHVLVAAGTEALGRRAADRGRAAAEGAARVVRERCRVACEHARPEAGAAVGVVGAGDREAAARRARRAAAGRSRAVDRQRAACWRGGVGDE